MALEVIYEDADLLAVVKPAGMFVHASPGHTEHTLVDELIKHFPAIKGVGSAERSGIVHRLDSETSGVMVAAKTQRTYLALRQMFESHEGIRKTYLAVLHGAIKPRKGTMDNLIGKPPRRAVSHWEVLQSHGGLALTEFVIETGRMHQIRIHASQLGHPVVGDKLYGRKDGARRLLLHAVQLEFTHPFTHQPLAFAAEPPPEIIYPR